MTALIYSVLSSYSVLRTLGMDEALFNVIVNTNHDIVGAVNRLQEWN
jgi:hypothetical protein